MPRADRHCVNAARRAAGARITYHAAKREEPHQIPKDRRRGGKHTGRSAILDAARRVAARDGARDLSVRGVAAEAGFAPAALYGYFRNKDELLLALAADDLTALARAMRGDGGAHGGL